MEDSERKPDYNSAALSYFEEARKTADIACKTYGPESCFGKSLLEIANKDSDLSDDYLSFIEKEKERLCSAMEDKGVNVRGDGSSVEGYEEILGVISLISKALFLLRQDVIGISSMGYPEI